MLKGKRINVGELVDGKRYLVEKVGDKWFEKKGEKNVCIFEEKDEFLRFETEDRFYDLRTTYEYNNGLEIEITPIEEIKEEKNDEMERYYVINEDFKIVAEIDLYEGLSLYDFIYENFNEQFGTYRVIDDIGTLYYVIIYEEADMREEIRMALEFEDYVIKPTHFYIIDATAKNVEEYMNSVYEKEKKVVFNVGDFVMFTTKDDGNIEFGAIGNVIGSNAVHTNVEFDGVVYGVMTDELRLI